MTDETTPPEPEVKFTAEEEANEYKDKYLRLLAEMDNTRKRMQKEKQEMTRFAVENVISEILIPIDNMENALKMTENASPDVRNWAQGFVMILNQFREVLTNNGVTSFVSEGEIFNPEIHYAIESEATSEKPEGTILKEYVKGYRSGDRIVRPAQVKVATRPESQKAEAPAENSSFNNQ